MAFPANPGDLEVCIAFGANLASDLTTLTYSPNLAPTLVQPRVVITRGRIGGAARSQPTTIDLGLKNPGGVFSPRNISGPHYGQLRRNTPIRVRLDPGTGMVTRAIGYLPDWPTRWTGPDIDDRIPMQASGPLRRLGVGRDVKSALTRSIDVTSPVGHWPVEDARGSTTLASTLPRGPAGSVRGDVSLGSTGVLGTTGLTGATSFARAVTPVAEAASGPTPGNLTFPFPSHAFSGTEVLTFWTQGTPWESRPAGGVQVTVDHSATFSGSAANGLGYADIHLVGYDSTGGYTSVVGYWVQFYDKAGLFITEIYTGTTRPTWSPFDGRWHEVQLVMVQSGPDTVASLYVDGTLGGTVTMAARVLTSLGQLVAGRTGYYQNNVNAYLTPYQAPYSIGHVSLHTTSPTSFFQAGIGAYSGEWASTRFQRLCTEENIANDAVAGPLGESMGSQLPGNIVDLLRECEDTNAGVMVERRTGLLGLDQRRSRYNRGVAMTVNYPTQVADLLPDDDDRDLRNYVTVTRISGSSATVERSAGPLGTNGATGVDRYPVPVSRSLGTDEQAQQHAGWLSMVGTVDEPRYTVGINLRARPELVTQWLACDISSRILITNPPAIQVGPAPLDLIIEGYQELLDGVEWMVTIHALPYRPYEVFQVESGAGNRSRIPAGVSTTDLAYAATATSLSVTSAVTRWIDSATYPTKFPIVIECAGEVMTCTAIAGTGLTQTFTVARGLHGVSKPLPINSPVQIWRPACIAL